MGLEVETLEEGERRKPVADYIADHDGEGDVTPMATTSPTLIGRSGSRPTASN